MSRQGLRSGQELEDSIVDQARILEAAYSKHLGTAIGNLFSSLKSSRMLWAFSRASSFCGALSPEPRGSKSTNARGRNNVHLKRGHERHEMTESLSRLRSGCQTPLVWAAPKIWISLRQSRVMFTVVVQRRPMARLWRPGDLPGDMIRERGDMKGGQQSAETTQRAVQFQLPEALIERRDRIG